MNSTALKIVPSPNFEDLPPVPLPSSLSLFRVLNQFLIRWAKLTPQYVNAAMEDMSPLPLEQSIFFSGPLDGLMVIRSTREFEKFLVETLIGDKSERPLHKKGLFLEMTVLFWHQLVLQTWRKDSRTLPPALLKNSVPIQWPDRKPYSVCTVFIQHIPLEIRLWAPLSEDEKKAWQKSFKSR
jgi:hypothetical protein